MKYILVAFALLASACTTTTTVGGTKPVAKKKAVSDCHSMALTGTRISRPRCAASNSGSMKVQGTGAGIVEKAQKQSAQNIPNRN